MARKFLTPIDLTQNELQNAVVQHLASAPLAPIDGLFYLNSTATRLYMWNATASAWQWKATDSDLLNTQPSSYYLALGNATGMLTAAQLPAFTGDVTSPAGSSVNTIAANAVSLAKQAQLAPNSIQGNNTGSPATPLALTIVQTKALLAIAVTDVSGAQSTANLGVANGYAGLDSTGKVPTAQLPAAVLGGLNYQGTWNASTNSPTLVSSTGTKGYYYKVATAGTTSINGIASWNLGDSIVFDGSTWDKIDGLTNEMISVAGRTGVVTLASTDISGLAPSASTDTTNASNITSGTLPAAQLPTSAVQKYATGFGDGSTFVYTITHNLGTQDVTVEVYATASPYNEIDVDVNHATTNTVTLTFSNVNAAPTLNQYRVVVHG